MNKRMTTERVISNLEKLVATCGQIGFNRRCFDLGAVSYLYLYLLWVDETIEPILLFSFCRRLFC